jgi:hypothetical protein
MLYVCLSSVFESRIYSDTAEIADSKVMAGEYWEGGRRTGQ